MDKLYEDILSLHSEAEKLLFNLWRSYGEEDALWLSDEFRKMSLRIYEEKRLK